MKVVEGTSSLFNIGMMIDMMMLIDLLWSLVDTFNIQSLETLFHLFGEYKENLVEMIKCAC